MDPILTIAGRSALSVAVRLLVNRVLRPSLPSAGLAEHPVRITARRRSGGGARVGPSEVARLVRTVLLRVADADPRVRAMAAGDQVQDNLCCVLTHPDGLDMRAVQKAGMDPGTLSQQLLADTELPHRLRDDQQALFDAVLRECCVQIVDHFSSRPEFVARALTEQGARLADVHRLVTTDRDTDRDMDARSFEARYLDVIEPELDQLQLFGLKLRREEQAYVLTSAYVSLSMRLSEDFNKRPEDLGDVVNAWYLGDWVRTGLDVNVVLNSSTRILIEGPAGSGKTTLLRRMALHCIRDDWPDELLAYRGKVPFLLPMRSFAVRDLPAPEDFVTVVAPAIAALKPDRWVSDLLTTGRALLLLDGVDEMAQQRRAAVLHWVDQLRRAFPNATIILTSRPAAIDVERLSLRDAGFATSAIEPMTPAQVDHFLSQWHAERESQMASTDTVVQARRRLQNALLSRRDLRRIATTPLLCAMLCALNLTHYELPRGRAKLYRAGLEMLLEGRDQDQQIDVGAAKLDIEQSESILSHLAFWMLANGQRVVSRDEALAYILDVLPRIRTPDVTWTPDAALDYLLERAGVLQSPAIDEIEFRHPSFQDYLAAAEILRRGLTRKLIASVDEPLYQDVIIMAVGQTQTDPDRQDAILDGLVTAAHKIGLRAWLLAAAAIADLGVVNPERAQQIEKATRGHLPPQTSHTAQEIAAAGGPVLDLLGQVISERPLAADEVTTTALTLSLIPDSECIPLAKRLSEDPQRSVQDSLVQGWYRTEDPGEYAKHVLSGPHLGRVRLSPPSSAHMPHLIHVRSARIIDANGIEIDNPECLHNLSELEILKLEGCSWPGTLPLHRFPTLVRLNLKGSSARDVDGTASCPRLRYVDLSDTAVTDLRPLAAAKGMIELLLSGTPVTDLTPLGALQNMRILDLSDSAIEDIDVLHRMRKLEHLDLSCTRISALGSLTHTQHLQHLDLTDCPITSLRGLGPTPNLQRLAAGSTQLSNLNGLGTPVSLRWLRLAGSPIRSLTGIEGAAALTELDLTGTLVTDLGPLANLNALRSLDLSYTPIRDLSPLTKLRNLRTLRLDKTLVEDISPLHRIPTLQQVTLNGIMGNNQNAPVLWV